MKPSEAIEKVKHLKNFLMVYEDIHQVTLMTDSDKEAIDTVVEALEKPLPTDEQIEQYALKNILNGVGIQSMKNTKTWIAGATWMRDLIQERSKK